MFSSLFQTEKRNIRNADKRDDDEKQLRYKSLFFVASLLITKPVEREKTVRVKFERERAAGVKERESSKNSFSYKYRRPVAGHHVPHTTGPAVTTV